MEVYSEEEKTEDYLFKIVLIGDSAVGKSNLLARFARNEFYPNSKSTIGVEFQTQKRILMEKKLKHRSGIQQDRNALGLLHLHTIEVPWELSWSMMLVGTSHLIALANGLMSFIEIIYDAHSDMNVVTILIGNKTDLKDAREVSTAEGKALAEAQGLFFMETSALDSSNVTAAFQTVVKEIYNILSRKVISNEFNKQDAPLMGDGKTVVLQGDDINQEGNPDPQKGGGCC
ncbi:hypothetical protein GH714_010257 [Hevea brasiliensis]|uniref:Uncharacterized protein n=1 Tax=Hevea brasiliensis TaxID=3981 RepID=A0A6A6M117_HEVBR|nr:hypothetical protein GH714_010257 [Hevea brasiliensis]